jgi:hypothetical protein
MFMDYQIFDSMFYGLKFKTIYGLKAYTWTDPEYLNDAKCENIIWWPPKFKSISLAYSEIQVVDWLRRLYLSNIQDLSDDGL